MVTHRQKEKKEQICEICAPDFTFLLGLFPKSVLSHLYMGLNTFDVYFFLCSHGRVHPMSSSVRTEYFIVQ